MFSILEARKADVLSLAKLASHILKSVFLSFKHYLKQKPMSCPSSQKLPNLKSCKNSPKPWTVQSIQLEPNKCFCINYFRVSFRSSQAGLKRLGR